MRGKLLVLCVAFTAVAGTAPGAMYLGYERWGGTWSDAEKSPLSAEDDLMCWAAAAANVLDWTGWGGAAGFGDADAIFTHFQDHWTDAGGVPGYGWNWWFDGTNPSQSWANWSHVDVPGGGFCSPEDNFLDYYRRTAADVLAMSAVDEYLHDGFGVALVLTKPARSHVVTCWGYEYDEQEYLGVWITDSDDDRHLPAPADSLRYVTVSQRNRKWYLQDYRGTDAWYINEVQALERIPGLGAPPAPEPASVALLCLAGLALTRRRRR